MMIRIDEVSKNVAQVDRVQCYWNKAAHTGPASDESEALGNWSVIFSHQSPSYARHTEPVLPALPVGLVSPQISCTHRANLFECLNIAPLTSLHGFVAIVRGYVQM